MYVKEVGFDDRKVNPTHYNWAKTTSGSDHLATPVSSICCLTCPGRQIRSPVELGIEDQVQIFDLGTQRVACPTYARKGDFWNFISSFRKSVLKGLVGSPKPLHQFCTIDSATLNLCDSICRPDSVSVSG